MNNLSIRKKWLRIIRSLPFPLFAKRFLKIRYKKGVVEQFELNRAQIFAHDRIEEQRQKLGKVRAVIIKGRQQGFSTYIAGRFYKLTTERIGISTFILSHQSNTTEKLFEMVQRFHDRCDNNIKPKTTAQDKTLGMKFGGLESAYELGTARNPDSGRGFTAQLLHGSEVAFWPYASQILAGVMQAVPDEPGTEIILESTANGVGGAFYDYVMDAYRGDGEFILIFSPWYWEPGYQQTPDPNFIRTPEEIELAALVAAHPDGAAYAATLTDAQLAWRRKKIRELKSADLFRQEYPSHVHEAFLASGRPVFSVKDLIELKQRCILPLALYRFERHNRTFSLESDVNNIEKDDHFAPKGYQFEAVSGYLQIWSEPMDNERYSIGADVAEGLEHGDLCSCDVHDSGGRQVGHFHGVMDPDTFGRFLDALGRRYNMAFLGVERNNHGHATLQRLKDLNYPNLYMQEELDESDERDTKKVGWLTTKKTKPIIIADLNAAIMDGDAGIRCLATIDQCLTYVYDKTGAMGAREGCHDDCVMSYAIGKAMNDRMPKFIDKPINPNPYYGSSWL